MTSNTTGSLGGFSALALCNDNLTSWNQTMDKMYTYFYLMLFIPGLLLNTTALWVLCRHISKKTKAVIFMINLALADLAQILSLPLRIYYYFTHDWPFGQGMCLFCFYLKYLNMYAAIVFLVCISVQRCVFLLNPFSARRWRRRYDLLISLIVWVVVGLACSPFILMRTKSSGVSHVPVPQVFTSTQQPTGSTEPIPMTFGTNLSKSDPANGSCFKDLPMRKVSLSVTVTMLLLGELFGFLIPLFCISYSSVRIAWSLRRKQIQDKQNDSTRGRLQSNTSCSLTDKYQQKQVNREKQRALRMVLSCSALFLVCFAPYHINFLLYLMVSQDVVSDCATRLAVKQFHPVSLCLASLSSCLNPLLYYFLTAEFRMHLTIRTSSFSSSHIPSPISSPTSCPAQGRLLRMESSCSEKE